MFRAPLLAEDGAVAATPTAARQGATSGTAALAALLSAANFASRYARGAFRICRSHELQQRSGDNE